MNPILSIIQGDIKKTASESRELMHRIIALKWGSLENAKRAAEIKAVREPGGAPIRRAEVKRLRHPETGPERAQLWVEKRELKDKARHLLLAYAFVRGRPYASQERTCKTAPSLTWIASIIGEAGGQAPSLDTLKAWVAPTPKPEEKAA
jgi:hypothetical protein